MPAETLKLSYSSNPRVNRRRAKHPVLGTFAKVVLWIVAAGIVIAILIKLGFFHEPSRPIHVAEVSDSVPPRHIDL